MQDDPYFLDDYMYYLVPANWYNLPPTAADYIITYGIDVATLDIESFRYEHPELFI